MNKYPVKLGSVLDVKQWPNAEYSDERGKLSKVFADSDKKFGDISFNTIEHFFTTTKSNLDFTRFYQIIENNKDKKR